MANTHRPYEELWKDDKTRNEERAKKRAVLIARRKKAQRRRLIALAVMIAIIVSIAACSFKSCGGRDAAGDEGGGKVHVKDEPVTLSLLCVGDVMAHSPNIRAAFDSASGTYDFTDNYQYVSDYISGADLAMCNVETTFRGGTPAGYPMFNAPDSLAAALAGAGFDVAFTSNNHMMDTGFDGMQRTIEILRANGMVTAGSRYENEKPYGMTEVKGVKIGLVAYTYETTGAAGATPTINGNPLSGQSQKLVNSFNYHELDSEDYSRIKTDIDSARDDGADIVICYFHWGEEYQRAANNYQTAMAQSAANMGADVIFASHPHVIQNIDILTSQDGRQVPVFYSMGNFISNQRQETLQNRYTEQGMMAKVDIEYLKSTGEILSEKVSVIPTWVDKYNSGKTVYSIVPLDGNLSGNASLAASGHLSRAQQGLEDVRALIGDEYLGGKTILMGESKDDNADKSDRSDKADKAA